MKYLAIILIGCLLFFQALPNKFVWDDEEQIVENTAVHSISQIGALFSGSTFNSGGAANLGGLYYKPLMSICFAMLYMIFGPTPWAFHLFQIGLHIGSACLLFVIFKKLWHEDNLALGISLLFLIHPQNIETVAYISSLQDTLYMFLGMLGLTWIVLSENSISLADFVFAGVCVFLAMLGKETGAIFGIITGIYIWIFHKKIDFWKWVVFLIGIYGLYFYLRIGVAQVGFEKNMFTPMATLPLLVRLGNIPDLVWHYLSQFVWPAKLSISQHWVNRNPGIWQGSLLMILVCSWFGILWWAIKNNFKNIVFFWIWFGIAMVFHLQIFPLDMTVADRWFYLPMVGLLGFGGSLNQSKKFKMISEKLGSFLIIIILILFSIRSSLRIQDWRDGLKLYSHDILYMPESFDLQNNLGVELFRVHQYDEAKSHFENSTKLAPNWWTNWNNLGVIVEREGKLELALDYYNKAIQNGYYYLAYPNYARVLLKQKKIAEAQEFLKSSLQLFPNNTTLLDLYQFSLYTRD